VRWTHENGWPERIENYRRTIGVPYLGHENGWAYGTWFMGNSYEKKTDYYGGFQGNFLKRIAALFPDQKRVLHLFAGKVDQAAFPGDTLDCRPELAPTYCVNAETCDGVPLAEYDFVLADPPYTDAERYGTGTGTRWWPHDRHRRLNQSPVPRADGVPPRLTR
jgi:hypothetical protein